jgi:hypothetical protein
MNTLKWGPRAGFALGLAASVFGVLFVSGQVRADDGEWRPEKTVACSSDDGRRRECPADLRGYTVRDVDQSSRTECVVGRNWGYTDRGVWVDEGCRGNFMFDKERGGDHPRNWGYRESSSSESGEQKVTCESRDGKRNECSANLRGYRIADVHEKSKADCDIGRNFGYDDRGIWVDDGCRAEFVFERARDRRASERDFDRR